MRFRESRAGEEVASFNLYLAPNDVWTGAVVPVAEGAAVISSDVSCTEPKLDQPVPAGAGPAARGLAFHNQRYAADGMGAGLDRTLEGYVEVLEMATVTATTLATITHNSAGMPRCTLLGNAAANAQAPTGGLTGTLTLIDVSRGMDFTLRAEALADLATRPYFRPHTDPYPGFDAAEVDPVTVVSIGNTLLRSRWRRGRLPGQLRRGLPRGNAPGHPVVKGRAVPHPSTNSRSSRASFSSEGRCTYIMCPAS